MGLSPRNLPAPLFGPSVRTRPTRDSEAKRLAALLAKGTSTAPVEGGIGEVLARIGQSAVTGLERSRLDSENKTASEQSAKDFAAAIAGRADTDTLAQALSNPEMSTTQQSVLARILAGNLDPATSRAQFKVVDGRLLKIAPDGTVQDMTPPGGGNPEYKVVNGRLVKIGTQGVEDVTPDTAATAGNYTQDGIPLPDPPDQFVYVKDENGFVQLDENGAPAVQPLPGSTAELKRREAEQKQQQATQAEAREFARVKDTATRTVRAIDTAMAKVTDGGFLNQGQNAVLRTVLQMMPGSTAADIRAAIQTVKANLGFNELTAMRQASGNGASGLGQVTEKEIAFLQSVEAALDLDQSTDQFMSNLAELKRIHDKILNPAPEAPAPDPNLTPAPGQQPGALQSVAPAAQPPETPEGVPEIGGFTGIVREQSPTPPPAGSIVPQPGANQNVIAPLDVGKETVINGVRIKRVR